MQELFFDNKSNPLQDETNSKKSENQNPSASRNTHKDKFSIGQKFKNWATNLNFKLDNYVHNVELDRPLVYLGKMYLMHMKEDLDRHISETIWFSYREKIPCIMKDTFPKKYLTCDRGWGCMLRCGQMMLAEGIKRHYETKGKLVEEVKRESLLTIISLFADFVKEGLISPFSVQQICPVAYELFGSRPGEWYRASSVMMSMDVLHEKYGERRISDFRLCIFKDGTIYEDQIIKKALEKGKDLDRCNLSIEKKQKKENMDTVQTKGAFNDKQNNCHAEGEEINEEERKESIKDKEDPNGFMKIKENNEYENGHKLDDREMEDQKTREIDIEGHVIKGKIETKNDQSWNNSVLIFVATKTGLSKHNELYLPTVRRLLKFSQSIGILGGKDTKGYYFLGYQEDTLLYLDPHYVQGAYENFTEMEKKYDSHFRNKFFQVEIDEIDTSIGFGFYLRDSKDYSAFKRNILKAITQDPNFLVGFQETTPSLELKKGDIIEIGSFGDENFEVVS